MQPNKKKSKPNLVPSEEVDERESQQRRILEAGYLLGELNTSYILRFLIYRPHEVIATPLRHHSVDILSDALFLVWLPY